MPTLKTNTSAAAADVQLRVLRALGPEGRLAVALDMSLAARALLAARLRREHAGWPEAAVAQEVLRQTLPWDVLPPSLR